MAECPYQECSYSKDCEILDITKKVPKSKEKCSYFTKESKKKGKKDSKEGADI